MESDDLIRNYNLDLSEFRVVWAGETPFLVPNRLTLNEEKYLIASQLTLALRNVSVDNVLKNLMNEFEIGRKSFKRDKIIKLLDDVLKTAREQNGLLFKRLNNIDFIPETVSSFACEGVFNRLQTTIKSIHFHLKFGYYFESFALIRLLLEQIAYAYTASKVANGKKLDFLSPSESINQLKKIIPKAGKMYGLLSKFSYIDKSTIYKYIEICDGKIMTIHNSIFYSLEASIYYLNVLAYQNLVFEYCFCDYLKEYLFIDRNKEENKIGIRTNYKYKKEIKELIRKIRITLDKKHKHNLLSIYKNWDFSSVH